MKSQRWYRILCACSRFFHIVSRSLCFHRQNLCIFHWPHYRARHIHFEPNANQIIFIFWWKRGKKERRLKVELMQLQTIKRIHCSDVHWSWFQYASIHIAAVMILWKVSLMIRAICISVWKIALNIEVASIQATLIWICSFHLSFRLDDRFNF